METNETVEQVCDNIRTRITELWDQAFGCMENGEVDEFADRIEAAHKCEITAKDAEIDQLKVRNIETQNAVDGRDKEIARLRELVKELKVAIKHMGTWCINCTSCARGLVKDKPVYSCPMRLNWHKLVVKGQEEAK